MMKLKIDSAKTFLPISISKGSVTQRMQKARVLNIRFYENLQDKIRNNEVSPRTFIKTLRQTLGANLGIDIAPVGYIKDSFMSYHFDSKAINKGYILGFPLAFYTGKVHKNFAKTFLHETQNMLNEAFNPKILQRYITLINKGYDIKSLTNFYKDNISQTSVLTSEALDKFLVNKKDTEKIDSLQFMRYKLLSEKNTAQASHQIDNKIQQYNNLKYDYPDDYYDITKYHFDEKFKLLETKLADIIKIARSKD